jgi:hypothetical protein
MRMVHDDTGHMRPEMLVHRGAATHRALSVPASKPGRRGLALVIPTMERKADDKLRQLTAPLSLSWVAVASLVYLAHRGHRQWGRPDQAQTRGGDQLGGMRMHHDGMESELQSWRRIATDGVEEGRLGAATSPVSM